MDIESFDERGETPTVEVRVYRHGEPVHRELCESEEQAALVIEEWSEQDGISCEVDDLSVHHRPGDILEPDPVDVRAEEHAERREI